MRSPVLWYALGLGLGAWSAWYLAASIHEGRRRKFVGHLRAGCSDCWAGVGLARVVPAAAVLN